VVRRLPQPLPGTGAIAEYAELGNFGMRVVMSYQPNTLEYQISHSSNCLKNKGKSVRRTNAFPALEYLKPCKCGLLILRFKTG